MSSLFVEKEALPPKSAVFSKKDIPLGKCIGCETKQSNPGEGGVWLGGESDQWACNSCFYGKRMKSHAFACEWCTFADVKWYQFNTYDCPRCNALGIKH